MLMRDGVPTDAAGIARVHVDGWRTTYAGLVPAAFLDGLSYERSEQNWLRGLTNPKQSFYLVVEDPAGGIAGFACGGPERDGRLGYQGGLYALYVLKEQQRRGLGRALVAHTARRLLERGLMNMFVWVLADNPNRHFYAALGGGVVAEKSIEIGGATLSEVAYGWESIGTLAEASSPASMGSSAQSA